MFGTSNFGMEELRHHPVNFGTKLICAEANEIFQNLCRSSCAEVNLG